MASELSSLNDLPDELLQKILSYFGPEAKVCERWNELAKDVIFWKRLSYNCDNSSDISCVAEVRCTKLFGFRANTRTNFAPSSVLKVQNLKRAFQKLDLSPS